MFFFFLSQSKITGGRTGGTTGNTQVHQTPTPQPSNLKVMHVQQHVKKNGKVKSFQALFHNRRTWHVPYIVTIDSFLFCFLYRELPTIYFSQQQYP